MHSLYKWSPSSFSTSYCFNPTSTKSAVLLTWHEGAPPFEKKQSVLTITDILTAVSTDNIWSHCWSLTGIRNAQIQLQIQEKARNMDISTIFI